MTWWALSINPHQSESSIPKSQVLPERHLKASLKVKPGTASPLLAALLQRRALSSEPSDDDSDGGGGVGGGVLGDGGGGLSDGDDDPLRSVPSEQQQYLSSSFPEESLEFDELEVGTNV
jgi:hypothetical protein